MGWAITLGRISGTAVRIHVTFLLFLVWIGVSAGLSGGRDAALANVAFIVALFACVLAHEFGHIFMARRYGIATPEVTLLPIGGVALLERLPEKPFQQLMVAVAGPAVNVVIAIVLMIVLGSSADSAGMTKGLASIDDARHGLLTRLAAANIFLVLFNMIPAFPMDGGRVLNAVLAMNMDKRKAMQISARIGQGLALAFGFLGLFGNPMLLFIAIFVYMGAAGEVAQSDLESVTAKLSVRDATETSCVSLPADATLGDAVNALVSTPQSDFPLVDAFGKPMGLLTRDMLIAALREKDQGAFAAEALSAQAVVLRDQGALDAAIRQMNAAGASAANVVDVEGRLVGLLTLQNIAEMMMVRAARPEWRFAPRGSISN